MTKEVKKESEEKGGSVNTERVIKRKSFVGGLITGLIVGFVLGIILGSAIV